MRSSSFWTGFILNMPNSWDHCVSISHSGTALWQDHYFSFSYFITLFWSQVWHDNSFSIQFLRGRGVKWLKHVCFAYNTKPWLEPHICFPPQLFKLLHQFAACSESGVINGLFMSLRSHYCAVIIVALAKPLSLSIAVGSLLKRAFFFSLRLWIERE